MARKIVFFVSLQFQLLFCSNAFSESQPIDLKTIMQRAAEQSVSLRLSRLATEDAELSSDLAGQNYIPLLELDLSYRDVFAVGAGPGNGTLSFSSSVFWRTTVGSELRATLNTNHILRGQSGIPLSRLGFTASQNLLSGAWGADNDLDVVALDASIAKADFIVELNNALMIAARRYFSLSTAKINHKIAKESVQRAQRQFEDTAENIKRGLLAKGDIYVVEENLVFFQQQLLAAKEEELRSTTELASYLKLDPSTTFDISSETPLFDAPKESTLDAHPILIARTKRIEQAEKRLRKTQINTLPSLAIVGGLGFNGTHSSFGSALGESFSFQNPDATIGLSFSTPLSYSGKSAVEERAQINLRREHELKIRDSISIEEDLFNAKESLSIRKEILQLSTKRFKLTQLKLATELEKFKNGVSRLPEVVRFQRDVDTADFARTRARVAVNLIVLQWYASLAKLHERFDIGIK